MAAIKYSVDIQITGGPRVNFNNTLDVDAYDRIDAVIPTGGAATDVQVAPGGAVLQLLLIKSSDPSDDVTFDNGGTDIGLKSPMLLSGGAIGILAGVETVAFKNATAADVTVTILVGRDATPP